MSLRKIAVLLAAGGLAVGLIGGGVGAQFTDQVKAIQNITVGTFGCSIASTTPGAVVAGKTVTYSGTLTSSTAGSALFDFTVAPTGSIGVHAVVSVTSAPVSPFSAVMPTPTAFDIPVGGSQTFAGAGMSWPTLDNNQLGHTYSVTFTVDCTDQGGGLSSVIFDNAPAGPSAYYSPNRYYSESLGANGYTQFGTQVGFTPASPRNLQTVTVAMSDWACQTGAWTDGTCRLTTPGATFNVPITFNVYRVDASNTVGALVATKTQTFAIPYRPSADPACGAGGGASDGAMFKDAAGHCQNGFVSEITFAFAGETVPNTVIFGIAYPTTGDAGSLNVMLYPSDADSPLATQPAVGTFPLPAQAYSAHPNLFQLDPGYWGGTQPAVQFTAN